MKIIKRTIGTVMLPESCDDCAGISCKHCIMFQHLVAPPVCEYHEMLCHVGSIV